MSLRDIVVGGAITLAGTGVGEMIRARVASSDRTAKRQDAARDYERVTLRALRETAAEYRDQLIEYRGETKDGAEASAETDRKLRAARMAFQAVVYEAPENIINAFEVWEIAAVDYSQREGGAAAENRLWKIAMKACGAQSRGTHKIR